MSSNTRTLRDYRRYAEAQGWTVKRTTSGHWLWRSPDGRTVTTPSDRHGERARTLENTLALLRRNGVPTEPPLREQVQEARQLFVEHRERARGGAIAAALDPGPALPKPPVRKVMGSRPWTEDERRTLATHYGDAGKPNPEHRQALAYQLRRTTRALQAEMSRLKTTGQLNRYQQRNGSAPEPAELAGGPPPPLELPQAIPLPPPTVEARPEPAAPEPTLAQATDAIAALTGMLEELADDFVRFRKAQIDATVEFRGKLAEIKAAQGEPAELARRLAELEGKVAKLDPLGPFRAKLQG